MRAEPSLPVYIHAYQHAQVEHVPAREDVVNHLSEKGFQVVAAGMSAGEVKILFCARKASIRATEVVWFLCEFNISLGESSLSCVMKCPVSTD